MSKHKEIEICTFWRTANNIYLKRPTHTLLVSHYNFENCQNFLTFLNSFILKSWKQLL